MRAVVGGMCCDIKGELEREGFGVERSSEKRDLSRHQATSILGRCGIPGYIIMRSGLKQTKEIAEAMQVV